MTAASAAREDLDYVSVFPLQVEIYLIVIVFKAIKLESYEAHRSWQLCPTNFLEWRGKEEQVSLPEKCLVLCACSSVFELTAILF